MGYLWGVCIRNRCCLWTRTWLVILQIHRIYVPKIHSSPAQLPCIWDGDNFHTQSPPQVGGQTYQQPTSMWSLIVGLLSFARPNRDYQAIKCGVCNIKVDSTLIFNMWWVATTRLLMVYHGIASQIWRMMFIPHMTSSLLIVNLIYKVKTFYGIVS